MATVILNHKVKDYQNWKPLYDADAARRNAVGMRELAVGEKANDPGNVFIIWQVEDAAAVEMMLQDPELHARMAEGGVISTPELIIIH